MDSHPIIRRYTSTAQAMGDVAILESAGISSYMLGDGAATVSVPLQEGVCLCVDPAEVVRATQMLRQADLERYAATVPAKDRRKTFGRYVKIGSVVYTICFGLGLNFFRGIDGGIVAIMGFSALTAATPAILIGGACAILDL